MENLYKKVAETMINLKQCVALTGAGISEESGIPTFRDKGGLWEKYDPMVYASIDVFMKDPSKYWSLRDLFIKNYDDYKPNKAHYALKDLEEIGILRCVITQNIDGLHIKAGNKNVIEIHGSIRKIFCLKCNKKYEPPNVPDGIPPYCSCGGLLKPNTVLFGEELPPEAIMKAKHESMTCKIMLLIGTSAIVYPAASLPHLAQQNGAQIVEINIEQAFPNADYYIKGKAGVVLPKIVEAIRMISIDR